jgi:hypothetical protein
MPRPALPAALLAALLATLVARPAAAELPLTAEDFDALTLGQTMTWAEFGQVYGVEQYLEGRRVRWTVLGEDCVAGHWYPRGQAICFVYDDDPGDPACWTITLAGPGLLAVDTEDPPGAAPVVIEPAAEPMPCFGPEVGV